PAAASAALLVLIIGSVKQACLTLAHLLALGAAAFGRTIGGIGIMIISKSRRVSGLIKRYREARAAGRVERSPQISEFEQGMLDRLAPASQVMAWADQLLTLNTEAERLLALLAESEEAQSRDVESLVETLLSAIQEDALRAEEVKANPYSLYWTLWLKDEREIMSTDLDALIQNLKISGACESTCSGLTELKDRYQAADPKFYSHFGSLILLYDLYPPQSVCALSKESGMDRCGRAMS
ncbi:MAG: hypothetical protein Q7N50_02320, partial [Armatimonadota bacterium]|nr:hypothetical protein [Armatimonadota bacterium]